MFSRFLKKKNKKTNFSQKRYANRKIGSNSSNFACFNYRKQGHIKLNVQTLKTKSSLMKKFERENKTRRDYVVCQDNYESSSSTSSKTNKEFNLFSMVVYEYSSNVSIKDFETKASYNQLLNYFNEMHEEVNRLVISNNKLKGMNNWLENGVSKLEEKLNNDIFDLENLNFFLRINLVIVLKQIY